MPQIDVKPLVLKDVLLTLGVDSYEKHVSSVTFTPSFSQIEWRGLNPDAVFTDPGSGTWSCALEYAQDWDTPSSLSRYLYDNEGQTVPALFQPRNGQGMSWTADLTIIPGAIGGAVNAYATTTVTLGVQGRPVPSGSLPAPSAWAATTAYEVDDRVSLSGGAVLRAVAAGTSDAAEPAAPGVSNVVVDGDVAWLQTA